MAGKSIHEALDASLPPHLKDVISYGRKSVVTDTTTSPAAEAAQTVASQNDSSEVPTMPDLAPTTPAATGNAPVQQAASQVKIMTEAEIASLVTKTVAESKTAEQRDQYVANLVRESANYQNQVASLTATLEHERQEAAKAKKAADDKKAEDEKEDLPNKFKKQKADLDELQGKYDALLKTVDSAKVEKVVAERKTTLQTAGITNTKFVERATKVEADKLVMSDADFNDNVEMLKEHIKPGTTTDQQQASTQQQAPGNPATPPAQQQNTPPATQQTATQQPPVGTPAAPDLSNAGAFSQQVAALAGAGTPSAGGAGGPNPYASIGAGDNPAR